MRRVNGGLKMTRKMCKDCELYKNNEIELLKRLEDVKEERDRFYSFILALKNMIESLPEFSWKE